MIAEKILHNCDSNPEKLAVISGNKMYVYKDLKEKINKFITVITELNLKKQEPIAIIMANCIDFLALLFASELTKHCAVLLNEKFKLKEIEYHINSSGVRYAVTSGNNYEMYEECGFRMIQKLDDVVIWESTRKKDICGNIPEYQQEDYICQVTSGTNGTAKGVVRTLSAVSLEIKETIQCTGMQCTDVFLTIPPICHSFGLIAGALIPLYMGAMLVLPETFIVADIVNSIEIYHVNILLAVPFMYQMICEIGKATKKLSSLEICFSAGTPMSEDLFKKFYEVSGVYITQDYGATETGVMCINRESHVNSKSVGKPVGSRCFKVIDDNGKECNTGEEGYLITKSFCNARRYLYPVESNSNYLNGWLRLGDCGYIDNNGNIYVKGRMSDFINVAGMKVDPSEVEKVIMEIPGVKEVVVIGKASSQYGEVVKACVVASKDVSKRNIINYCRSKIVYYKVPKVIDFFDRLPKSPKGTIQKKYL